MRHHGEVPLIAVALLLPVLLLGLMLGMERVERPLRVDDVGDLLEGFLDSARPEEEIGRASCRERVYSSV